MANRTTPLDEELYQYWLTMLPPEPPQLRALREATAGLPGAGMQIAPEQGAFMSWLLRLTGARNCIEIGVFTGYSALACALALPPGGRLLALDISNSWLPLAQEHWQRAGVADRIDFRHGPARETLRQLLDEGAATTFDFMFVDADKTGYAEYLRLGLELLRPGGVMAFDNVFWDGRVASPGVDDPDTRALRQIALLLRKEGRLDLTVLPVGDGLALARKTG